MKLQRRALRTALPLLFAATAATLSACANADGRATTRISGNLAVVEVVDRNGGAPLNVYSSRGDRFIVGTPGSEYRLRIRNLTGERVLAVASVDGVNVVSGETAAPSQSGYVLGPWETLDVDGWRTSLQKTAAFYFTDLGDSYAARTGRPRDVGVIGVALFRERARAPEYAPPSVSLNEAQSDSSRTERAKSSKDESESRQAAGAMAARPAPSLGTGYGRDEWSSARRVVFERASSSPVEVLSVRYDRRDNLIAMGVLPSPQIIGRSPDAFPGSFVAPPPR